jgi:TatD DNase family protein
MSSNSTVIADTHCHFGAYSSRDEVLARAVDGEVKIVVATSRPSEYRDLSYRFGASSGIEIGLGFHPECAGSIYVPYELEICRQFVSKVKWISEVGMDAVIADGVSSNFGATPTLVAQRELLDIVLDMARPEQVLSIHSRGAEEDVIDAMRQHGLRRGVLHYFLGSNQLASKARDEGLSFSVHPHMLKSAEGREFVEWVPLDAMLFETDGPYFSTDGRPIEPMDCLNLASAVAEMRGMKTPDLMASVASNFDRLVSDS